MRCWPVMSSSNCCRALAALQEAGVLNTHPVAFFEFDWLGIHADAYCLAAQAVALSAITLFYGHSWLSEQRRLAV